MTCQRCQHEPHKHSGNGCATITISGPPSDQGKPVGDSYQHIGRTETICDCTGFLA